MPIKKLLERNALFIAILITALIAIISLVSLKGVHLLKTQNSDKYGHFLTYFILCLSWLNAIKNPLHKISINYIIIFLIICYGIILEVLQDILTTYRQADLLDIIANSAGVIFAVILYNLLKKKI
jgi:VanZ family protein